MYVLNEANEFWFVGNEGEYKPDYMLTRWGEEGPRQLSVSGDLSDLCCDVDEATDHRRDPVKAQQSDIDERLDRSVSMRNNKFPIYHFDLYYKLTVSFMNT